MRRYILIEAPFRACVLPAKLSSTCKSTIKNEEGKEGKLKKGGGTIHVQFDDVALHNINTFGQI